MPEHDPNDDVLTELIVDHREVEELFVKLEGDLSAEDRQDALEQVVAELVRHAVAEEAWLYPAMRDFLDDGNALADREISEHHEVERMLKELEGSDPHDPASLPVLQALMTAVRGHVEEEEKQIFPALKAVCTPEQLHERDVPAALIPHRTSEGNRPSSVLLLDRLTPAALGTLVALYEHKVYIEGVLWGIDSFDQWGVELGKEIAGQILPALRGETDSSAYDSSTAALIARFRASNGD